MNDRLPETEVEEASTGVTSESLLLDHKFTKSAGAPKPERHRALLRNARIVLLSVFLPLGVLAGGAWLRYRLTHVEENDARVASEVVTIASRVDGWLMTRPVMEGDRVRKGQILGELDTRDAQLRLKTLEGNIAAHDAQIRQTTLQRETLEKTSNAQIANAQAQLAAAEAAAAVVQHQQEIARNDFTRADSLKDSGAMSQQQWDHAHSLLLQETAALRQAQATIATQKAALTQAEAQLGQITVLSQQIAVEEGERVALAAQADEVRQEIADRTLRAPSDGIVDATFIHAGDYVQAGQWLMMLHDPDDVWVEANVKETAVGRVGVNLPVKVKVDAYPGMDVHGRVLRVGNAATNQFALLPSPNPSGNFTKITQRVPVRIALDKPAHPLQPGLMVEVSIDVAH